MEHAEAVKLIKDYGFAVLKHQNNWLGEAYEALLRALLATPAPLATPSDKQEAVNEEPTAGYYYHHGWEAGKAAAQRHTSDKQEAWAFRSDGQLWVVRSRAVAMRWQEQGFEITPVAPLAQSAEQDRIDAELRFLDDDEITEAANKFRLGNPRFDTLRCFVNYVIIVAQHKGASK
jgi:hypothetical protein